MVVKFQQTLNYRRSVKLLVLSILAVTLSSFPVASDLKASKTNFDNENDEEDESMSAITTIRAKLHLYNTDTKDYDRIKIVGYLNGEGQVSYLDLKEYNQNLAKTNQTPLTVDLKFNTSNDVSTVMIDDEYFVCAYLIGNKILNNTANLSVYDCDEGNIGTSTTSDSVKLFSTMKKYHDSNTFYKTQKNLINDQISGKIKILVHVPLFDAKDIDDLTVVGMIKGEYNLLTLDVQNELGNEENDGDRISIPFNFNRETEAGPIQPRDIFFGCVTSDEFPNQNSDCEKRMLADLSGLNSICARKDNEC